MPRVSHLSPTGPVEAAAGAENLPGPILRSALSIFDAPSPVGGFLVSAAYQSVIPLRVCLVLAPWHTTYFTHPSCAPISPSADPITEGPAVVFAPPPAAIGGDGRDALRRALDYRSLGGPGGRRPPSRMTAPRPSSAIRFFTIDYEGLYI